MKTKEFRDEIYREKRWRKRIEFCFIEKVKRFRTKGEREKETDNQADRE
jgi:hypothetical protein